MDPEFRIYKRMSLSLDKGLYDALVTLSKERQKSMSEIVREILSDELQPDEEIEYEEPKRYMTKNAVVTYITQYIGVNKRDPTTRDICAKFYDELNTPNLTKCRKKLKKFADKGVIRKGKSVRDFVVYEKIDKKVERTVTVSTWTINETDVEPKFTLQDSKMIIDPEIILPYIDRRKKYGS